MTHSLMPRVKGKSTWSVHVGCAHAFAAKCDFTIWPTWVQEHICYCQPCHPTQPSVYHKYGAVGATAFTIIVAVAPAIFVIACVALGLYLCQRRARNQLLLPKMIPFAELKVTSDSPVLYQGTVLVETIYNTRCKPECRLHQDLLLYQGIFLAETVYNARCKPE